jgi:hypothetical protein
MKIKNPRRRVHVVITFTDNTTSEAWMEVLDHGHVLRFFKSIDEDDCIASSTMKDWTIKKYVNITQVLNDWQKELGFEPIISSDVHDLTKRIFSALMSYARLNETFDEDGAAIITIKDLEKFGE